MSMSRLLRRARRFCAAITVAGLAAGCRDAPCEREMRALTDGEALRIHGLAQAEMAVRAVARLQNAVRCAGPEQVPIVQAHALLLRWRFESMGNVEALRIMSQALQDVGVPNAQADTRGADAALLRLVRYANALAGPGASPEEQRLAPHAQNAMDPQANKVIPKGTHAWANHTTPVEGCFSLINHAGLPQGTALVSLWRADKAQALHGGNTAVGIASGKPRAFRWCVSGGLLHDDEVRVNQGDTVVWQERLVVTPDAQVRGALLHAGEAPPPKDLCAHAQGLSAHVACALLGAGGAP